MDLEEIRSVFQCRKVNYGIPYEPKKEQISASFSLLEKRNCLCFLPTGFGKTLCFVINAVVRDTPSITLIISPLISLIDNQTETLSKWGFTCGRIVGDTTSVEMQGIAQGDYTFVFASPESVLRTKWRTIFLNDIWQQRLSCIVFDEAHCISEWGEDFRPDYRDMAHLRSFFRVPVLALTATSTQQIKQDIMSVLHLNETDTDVITHSANRPNIFLEFRKRKVSDYGLQLKWLIDYIQVNGVNSKKIIIYCRSIDTVAELFILLKDSLGKNAYVDQVEQSANLIIEMYHKCTHHSSKQRILSEFSKTNSTIRCLVATVALGMGLDIKDIDMIIHIGCPKSVISYWQEAGRCGRDGRQGFSLILYDNFTASLKSTDKAMANIVKNSENKCLRQMVIDYFSVSEPEKFSYDACSCHVKSCKCGRCTCCSLCAQTCQCVKEEVAMYATEFLNDTLI